MNSEEETVPQFREYFVKLKSKIGEKELEEFGKVEGDEGRIKLVKRMIPEEGQPPVKAYGGGKDAKKSKELKELGNKAFGRSNYKEALKLYSESSLLHPRGEGMAELALTVANRSAVFYHLQDFDSAVADIDFALSLDYPKELRYKVLERKAKCLLALRKHEEALLEFKNTIKALDECKLPSERKIKMQTDIQIMVGIMKKPTTSDGRLNLLHPGSPTKKQNEQHQAKLSAPRNKIYEAASVKVEIREEADAGRFACAAEDVGAGETILTEPAYCSVLLAEFAKTNCQHCLKRVVRPLPCDECSHVAFCSFECKKSACATYHKYECKVYRNLHESGVSVTVLMALRMISQEKLENLLRIRQRLETPEKGTEKYRSFDYLNVYNLVRHEKVRKREDFFERTVMALFLLRCLRRAGYFGDSSKEEDEDFVGGLLLRHLQILQFNAHEISQLEMKEEKNLDECKSVFIGGGLYATLALFNHSCDPGIVRYFEGTKVVVRAVKPIKKGEMIAENYGPIYSQTKKKERQEKLRTQYWFECKCRPCEELWPTFEEIDKNVIRFRCDARKESGEKYNDCNNVLLVPTNTEDFMVKCFLCGRITNLFKGLKALQDTDVMYQQASKDAKKGNYKAALLVYLEILTILHDILAPPFRDYLLCQQNIRKCMLTLGNTAVENF